MANKRELKKRIRYACGNLAAECLLARNFVKDIDPKKMDAIITDIADLQDMALASTNFYYDKVESDFPDKGAFAKAKHEYFKTAYASLLKKFDDHVEAIVKRMNAALPAEAKEANVSKD